MRYPINIASLSDIHLGHPRTPTDHIVRNLMAAFPFTKETADLDVIFIAGDVFDRLLTVPDPAVYVIRAWIAALGELCARYDIVLRVLKGTPLHDRDQSKMFKEIFDLMKLDFDFKYVEHLQIEHIPRFDMTVLYIEDDRNYDPNDTWVEVKMLMANMGLEKVDFAVIHGHMEFHLPEVSHAKSPPHLSENYRSIVRNLIFMGHIHTFSEVDRIVMHGSFDRLIHGEEEPKGHIRACVHSEGQYTVTFVENKGALIYKRIDVCGLDAAAVQDKVREAVNQYPAGSYLEFQGKRGDALFVLAREFKRNYPDYVLTVATVKEKEDKPQNEHTPTPDELGEYVPMTFSEANVAARLKEFMLGHGYDDLKIQACEVILNEQLAQNTF